MLKAFSSNKNINIININVNLNDVPFNSFVFENDSYIY